MKLTGYKVYRNGVLLFDNVDIEIPDIPGFHPVTRLEPGGDLVLADKFYTVDGKDIRKGAIDA
jgi:hypothetical protein